MKALVLAASAAFFVSAQAVELPDEILEQCAKAGGCIVTIPEGKVYPRSVDGLFTRWRWACSAWRCKIGRGAIEREAPKLLR